MPLLISLGIAAYAAVQYDIFAAPDWQNQATIFSF